MGEPRGKLEEWKDQTLSQFSSFWLIFHWVLVGEKEVTQESEHSSECRAKQTPLSFFAASTTGLHSMATSTWLQGRGYNRQSFTKSFLEPLSDIIYYGTVIRVSVPAWHKKYQWECGLLDQQDTCMWQTVETQGLIPNLKWIKKKSQSESLVLATQEQPDPLSYHQPMYFTYNVSGTGTHTCRKTMIIPCHYEILMSHMHHPGKRKETGDFNMRE